MQDVQQEQAAGGKRQDAMEICLETMNTGKLRDQLAGALIGLARATDGNEHLISESSTQIIVEGLYATLPNETVDNAALEKLMDRVKEEKRKMVPNCFACASPCGRTSDYDLADLRQAEAEIRALKSLLLLSVRGMAAYAYRAAALGCHEAEADRFFYKALVVVGIDGWTKETLLPIVLEAGELSLKYMAMLP